MNAIADPDVPPLTEAALRAVIEARDREIDNAFSKDAQVTAIHGARNYRGDKLIRVATPHKLLDPKAGPLIAVRLNILSRKTLGGLETDLVGPLPDRRPARRFPGLYAAGEVNGFGGGGMMGYNALEGTFLGGCLFSGRVAGRAAAAAVAAIVRRPLTGLPAARARCQTVTDYPAGGWHLSSTRSAIESTTRVGR